MAKKLAAVYGAKDYGLTLRQLVELGGRPVHVHVYYSWLRESRLRNLAPSERRHKIRHWLEACQHAVMKAWPGDAPTIRGRSNEPRGLDGFIPARAITTLRQLPQVESIFIHAIPGLKRQPRPATDAWFAVQARFVSQVEGQTRGRQLVEDRVLLVKARNAKHAERRLRPEFKAYGKPYLNGEGYFVAWVYERTLAVVEVLEKSIDPKGTEVFSEYHGRRLKPASTPQQKDGKNKRGAGHRKKRPPAR